MMIFWLFVIDYIIVRISLCKKANFRFTLFTCEKKKVLISSSVKTFNFIGMKRT